MLARVLQNHVFANLSFILVLVIGTLAYALLLPREKDPEINFNWVQVITALPGASASDVEKRVTNVLEEGFEKIGDIDFVSSYSREGLSSILIRFEDIDTRTFDKRMNDLRRAVRNQEDELPEEAEAPEIFEITSSNAFPTATLVISGAADDENLRKQAHTVEEDLERLEGVDRVDTTALHDPELQVLFDPRRLEGLGIGPTDLADTIAAWFRDSAAGNIKLGGEEWLLRLLGTDADPAYLADLPVLTARGEVPLRSLAAVQRGRAKADKLAIYNGQPAVILSVFKKSATNTLELVKRLDEYARRRNELSGATGVTLTLVDDQTESTRRAIEIMQRNALLGLMLVFATTWLFLGTRIAFLTSIGIPFTLAGTFWILAVTGNSLNTSVLLGVVIALGMLVDDAVVVVEGIYYRLSRGWDSLRAVLDTLHEVFAPVTTSVLTTMAAFLPLMLLPGILGDFMRVIPMTVTLALAVSLLEAYWMLPAHVLGMRIQLTNPSRIQRMRHRATHWLRVKYARALIRVLRRPRLSMGFVGLIMAAAIYAVATGMVHFNFFAMENMRLFYVNVHMPAGSSLEHTMAITHQVELAVRKRLHEDEVRSVVSYAGQMFTETEPLFGDHYGQILVSLKPRERHMRGMEEVVEDVRGVLTAVPGPQNVTLQPMKDGPPTAKAISVKVRGDDYRELREAAEALKDILRAIPAISDISDDAGTGSMELNLRLDTDAVQRAGLDPGMISRTLRLLADGEVVTDMQHEGERLDVRLRAREEAIDSIDSILRNTLPLPGGGAIALGDLVRVETRRGLGNIRHYNFRRAITVEAELDKTVMNTVEANERIQAEWNKLARRWPNMDLDFTGELDDIQESLDSIAVLFLFGIGLIYLILGTQFRSYFQPLMILITVPMAFTGVVAGLIITGHPLSLYTLYGIVALAGIAVNAAIVLISAANVRLERGMSVVHATVYAARRRVIPILITTLTTIAGLFSLATGLGGHSLLWGPVATAIVWGLAFSSVLTLFVVPLLYRLAMGRRPPSPGSELPT